MGEPRRPHAPHPFLLKNLEKHQWKSMICDAYEAWGILWHFPEHLKKQSQAEEALAETDPLGPGLAFAEHRLAELCAYGVRTRSTSSDLID